MVNAVDSGKHVFVEKPLYIKEEELNEIMAVYDQSRSKPIIMVGFVEILASNTKNKKLLLGTSGPKSFFFTGHIDQDHWTQDKDVGGGELWGKRVTLLIYFVSWQTPHS